MKIGELARGAQVNVETVRFYERSGLLPEPRRRASGYRDYGPEDLRRLRMIRHARSLGFSLPEAKDLLALGSSDAACEEIQTRVAAKIETVEQKIRALEQLKQTLSDLAASCGTQTGADECPVLAALAEAEG
jgi:MerR family transcriptional regulator, copper efflux regulator